MGQWCEVGEAEEGISLGKEGGAGCVQHHDLHSSLHIDS